MDQGTKKDTGNEGEKVAAEYLTGLGYKIIGRNIELFCGEIDILAKQKQTIVIVEVKTVRGGGFGLAKELVRYKKQEKLRNLARALEQKYPKSPLRIDVIGVRLDCDPPEIEHVVNAVEA